MDHIQASDQCPILKVLPIIKVAILSIRNINRVFPTNKAYTLREAHTNLIHPNKDSIRKEAPMAMFLIHPNQDPIPHTVDLISPISQADNTCKEDPISSLIRSNNNNNNPESIINKVDLISREVPHIPEPI